jgi:hypothetical protein
MQTVAQGKSVFAVGVSQGKSVLTVGVTKRATRSGFASGSRAGRRGA